MVAVAVVSGGGCCSGCVGDGGCGGGGCGDGGSGDGCDDENEIS